MSTSQSFGRIVKVRIFAAILNDSSQSEDEGDSVPTITYNNVYTEFSSIQPDGTPGFRIKGKITQTQSTVQFATNPVSISLYNLSKNSRAIIESKVGTRVAVFAGYQNNPKQIALADILWARTHKEGPDYITEILAGDAHFGMVNGTINVSFKGPTTYFQAIYACLDSLEDQQIFAGNIIGIPAGFYNNGVVLSGSTMDELKRICDKLGLSVNIIGNYVNIVPNGTPKPSPIIDISGYDPNTQIQGGLIGIPEVKPPGVIGVQKGNVAVTPTNDISFTTLLRPELSLSQVVRITSRFINGEYVIGSLVHDFDSWEGPFYTKCEGGKVDLGLSGLTTAGGSLLGSLA